ncbi:MAG: hypothetical protein Q9191_008467 [Dirinaria sp. TL-2023a]
MARNPILFGLGVVLLELAHAKSLESLKLPSDAENGQLHGDFFTARRLAKSKRNVMGATYNDIVEQLVECVFPCGSDLNDPKLQAIFYEDVIYITKTQQMPSPTIMKILNNHYLDALILLGLLLILMILLNTLWRSIHRHTIAQQTVTRHATGQGRIPCCHYLPLSAAMQRLATGRAGLSVRFRDYITHFINYIRMWARMKSTGTTSVPSPREEESGTGDQGQGQWSTEHRIMLERGVDPQAVIRGENGAVVVQDSRRYLIFEVEDAEERDVRWYELAERQEGEN